ncbi:MAG: autotransporter-associated beta strand repeat-containing protein [Luteolibacter sp.]|nr:autotransporter-associated beta strand repeat-containing protein [Luteolibacter sp.]
MKPTFNRLSRLSQLALAVATVTSAQAITRTWTAATGGDWSDAAKWDANGVPNVSTDDVVFNHAAAANINAKVDSAWGTAGNGSINSLLFSGGQTTLTGVVGGTLTLGAGGLTNSSSKTATFDSTVSVELGATQTWTTTNHVNFNGNLTLADGVTANFATVVSGQGLSIQQNSILTLNTGSLAYMTGPGTLAFNGGTTSTVGTGAVTFNQGIINLGFINQYGRLGTNALSVLNTNNTRIDFSGAASGTFATPVTFPDGLTKAFTIQYGPGSNAFDITGAQTAVALTGQWTGAVNGGNVAGSVGIVIHQGNVWDDRKRFVFQANNSGLTSSADPSVNSNAAIQLRTGYIVADHANAWGAGNSLAISAGVNNSDTGNVQSGVLATSGNHVASKIFVRINPSNGAGNDRREVVALGLTGSGSVNFTGNLYLQHSATERQVQVLKLTAPTGGTANFSGVIANNNSPGANTVVPIVVLGGGTVSLSGNNTYTGTTSVRGGTLLLGHDSALGGGSSPVSLGDTVSAPSGGDVVVATNATFSNATGGNLPAGVNATWAAGVYTFSGAGVTTFDGVTLNDGDRILVKDAVFGAEQTGVYVRTNANTWTRATDLDSAAELITGLRVHVTGGSNAGNNFYLPIGLIPTAVINNNGAVVLEKAKFGFNDDASSTADVAILTNGPHTISRDITVTNNLSSGKSILGGNTADSSTFTGAITLARDLTVTAASGGTVEFFGALTGTGFGVTKEGPGKVIFTDPKAYTGATAINEGTLEIIDSLSTSAVTVAAPGTLLGTGTVSAPITAAGTIAPGNSGSPIGTLTADGGAVLTGTLAVDIDGLNSDLLTAATGTLDISGATLTVTEIGAFSQPSYVIAEGSTLTGTFASVPPGYSVAYNGSQAILTKVAGSDYDTWKAGFTFAAPADSLPTADPDGDGLTNQQEYAFGLNPTLGTSVNPITVPLNKTTGTFTYTRRKLSLVTPLAYTVKTSTDLATWTPASISGESITAAGDIETVVVTLSGAPLSAPKLFVRVSAE